MPENFEGNLPPEEQKKETAQPSEPERKKFEGAQEWGDLVNVVSETSDGMDNILLHAERIFRTYDMGKPWSNNVDLEILRSAKRVVQEIKDRIELKGHY